MLPTISQKKLQCGCGSTNLSLIELQLGIGIQSFEIVCNNHRQKGNYVCSMNELGAILEEYIERNSLTEVQRIEIINTICLQISTSKIQVSYDADENCIIQK